MTDVKPRLGREGVAHDVEYLRRCGERPVRLRRSHLREEGHPPRVVPTSQSQGGIRPAVHYPSSRPQRRVDDGAQRREAILGQDAWQVDEAVLTRTPAEAMRFSG